MNNRFCHKQSLWKKSSILRPSQHRLLANDMMNRVNGIGCMKCIYSICKSLFDILKLFALKTF